MTGAELRVFMERIKEDHFPQAPREPLWYFQEELSRFLKAGLMLRNVPPTLDRHKKKDQSC